LISSITAFDHFTEAEPCFGTNLSKS